MSKLNDFFPKWISPRAFLVASLITGIQASKSLTTYGIGTESITYAIVQILAGGLFWGWILTRFFPKYFGHSKSDNSKQGGGHE